MDFFARFSRIPESGRSIEMGLPVTPPESRTSVKGASVGSSGMCECSTSTSQSCSGENVRHKISPFLLKRRLLMMGMYKFTALLDGTCLKMPRSNHVKDHLKQLIFSGHWIASYSRHVDLFCVNCKMTYCSLYFILINNLM